MTYGYYTAGDFARFERGRSSKRLVSLVVPGASALVVSALVGAFILYGRQDAPVAPVAETAAVTIVAQTVSGNAAAAKAYATIAQSAAAHIESARLALLDPALLGYAPSTLGHSGPVGSRFEWTQGDTHDDAAPADAGLQAALPAPNVSLATLDAQPVPAAAPVQTAAIEDSTLTEPHAPGWDVPLPMPRPREFNRPAHDVATNNDPVSSQARRVAAQAEEIPAAPPVASDPRSFFEKLFDKGHPSGGTALAYAAPEDGGLLGSVPRATPGARMGAGEGGAAVYDISTHTVYMPDGTRLEAHSGLGDRFDDPRYVDEHMRGPTPPATYELTLREQLFHGVQALRLSPIGGTTTYGRTGLLAHRFMLGPRGDSNGCVSFRNYPAFLDAYMRGEVRRLVVVARLN